MAEFYLFYGDEEILKKQQVDKVIKGFVSTDDEMNYSFFDKESLDEIEIKNLSETMPFFAEKRVIFLKNSGYFKANSLLADYAEEVPETTVFVFSEKEIDKRNKLYKFVSSNGKVLEVKAPDSQTLRQIVMKSFANRGITIGGYESDYFVSLVGGDLARIQTEVEKLASYVADTKKVTKEDIDTITVAIPEAKIFAMLDSLMTGQMDKVTELYKDLCGAHEKPMNILYMLTRSYDQLYKTVKLSADGFSRNRIAEVVGIRDFQVDKYLRFGKSIKLSEIHKKVQQGIDLEYKIKAGNIDERIAVEMFIYGKA